jgi:hypothetical protein
MLLKYCVNNACIGHHAFNHLLHLCLLCECRVLHCLLHDYLHRGNSHLFLIHEYLSRFLASDSGLLVLVILRSLLSLH